MGIEGSSTGRAALVDGLVWIRVVQLFFRPALAQHAIEVRAHDGFIAGVDAGEELEDGLARTIDEAACFAMRHRAVAADQVERQLDDHPNTTEPAALEECGGDLRVRFVFEFRHRAFEG